jgi:S-adenosylmethionine:tRNA ribosyltransferase-isomerase
MDIEDFNYKLPLERIAQEPLPSRVDSRMLVVCRDSGEIKHDQFKSISHYFEPGDALVVNDSRVIPARLLGKDHKGRDVEVFLINEMDDNTWLALVKPAKRVNAGLAVEISPGELEVKVVENLEEGKRLVRLETDGSASEVLERFGHVPLPPYIKRTDRPMDCERYQTVFARVPGSVAAPTAGLHFDNDLMGELVSRNVKVIPITLHVGPGTFRPVRGKDIKKHTMDAEYYQITDDAAEMINRTRRDGGSITALGTTTTRTLETIVDGSGMVSSSEGWTDLFIYPPFAFKGVDRLVTNFHLPKSTLLMLVSAFAGRELVLDVYREAIEEKYRFYSYGDVMMIV